MSSINLKKVISGPLDLAIEQLTEALKVEGFGVLTRIDLHTKVKEKLGKDLRPVVILGACNPQLAYEAYGHNPDVAALLPCNAVLRDLGGNRISVELAKPSALMRFLGDKKLEAMALGADSRLEAALLRLATAPVVEWNPSDLLSQSEKCEMIDVRRPDEFDGPLSHVMNSKLITLGEDLDRYLKEKSKTSQERPIIFICRSGARSMTAALQAQGLGLYDVINLKGGMIAWNEANLPTQENPKRSVKS
jgi:uncharacterized protein (DUF302 family)/rhodanese-related sulfurtransferase